MHIPALDLPPSGLGLARAVTCLPQHDLRHGLSDLERGSEILSHSVNYLVSEQLAGRRDPVAANREAIALLCTAGRQLAQVERRRPARRTIAAWLHGAALHRATHHTGDGFGDTGHGVSTYREGEVAGRLPFLE